MQRGPDSHALQVAALGGTSAPSAPPKDRTAEIVAGGRQPAQKRAPPAARASAADPEAHPVRVPLTSGAVRALSLRAEAAGLTIGTELAPDARVLKAFMLSAPARFALDVAGPGPRASQTLPLEGLGRATQARVGKLPKGTRVVIDLREAATLTLLPDGRYLLTF